MVVADVEIFLIIIGNGDVLEFYDGVIGENLFIYIVLFVYVFICCVYYLIVI